MVDRLAINLNQIVPLHYARCERSDRMHVVGQVTGGSPHLREAKLIKLAVPGVQLIRHSVS
jgi:hypothetical protein